ncbi:MAG: hypothetical protein QOF51_1148 [Chloroflexota bacterium]|nr:hypothetical protein [Chloroflexota bacterium]
MSAVVEPERAAAALTVLVLDDNVADAELMVHELRREGLNPIVEHVATEAAFVAHVGRPFDVILADYNLPQFDAIGALDHLAQRGLDTPLIVVSGSLTDEEALECIRRGAADYLLKDRLGRLPFAVRRVLADRQARRRIAQQRELLLREHAARAAAEAERDRLQQVIDVLPEGVAIADAAGRIVMRNSVAGTIWRTPPPLGDDDADAALEVWGMDESPYPPDGTPLARSVLTGEVVRGEQLLVGPAALEHKVPVIASSAPLRDNRGNVIGGVAVFQDVSQLKELDREKDTFLAATSHDLKNPLTGIRGHAQLLLRQAKRGDQLDPSRIAASAQRIDETVLRVVRMIDGLLDVAHLEMGQALDLHLDSVDLAALVVRVADEHQRTSEGHQILVETPSAAVGGCWDESRLERVLDNLVGNAIKYSPGGGKVRIGLAIEGDWAVLQVADEGVGIPAADLPHIFERFYRAGNVAGRFEGSGIGLAGARQIVEQHAGAIALASVEGQGTTITVRLPHGNAAARPKTDVSS